MKIRVFTFLIIFLSLSANVYSQKKLSDNASISILTCGPGQRVSDIYGHTGIRIKDLSQNLDVVFHYGLYNFETPGFVMKFLRGKLLYSMGGQKMDNFINSYTRQKRTVYEQVLNLDNSQKQVFYDALIENYQLENREYLYDFFFDNCATIIGDRIETKIGTIQYPTNREAKTFRNMLDEHQMNMPWTDFGIDLIIGSIADDTTTVNEQLFLPLYVHDILKESFIEGKPLVTDEKLLVDFIAESNQPYNGIFTPFNLFMALLILEMFLLGSYFSNWEKGSKAISIYDHIWYLLLGIGSLILLFMWYGTDHISTKDNWNLFWMNPIYLILTFALSKSSWSFLRLVLLAALLFNLATLVKFPGQFQEIHTASYLLVMITTLKVVRHFLVGREMSGNEN